MDCQQLFESHLERMTGIEGVSATLARQRLDNCSYRHKERLAD